MRNNELSDILLSRDEYVDQYRKEPIFFHTIQYLDAAGVSLENCVHSMFNMSKRIQELENQLAQTK